MPSCPLLNGCHMDDASQPFDTDLCRGHTIKVVDFLSLFIFCLSFRNLLLKILFVTEKIISNNDIIDNKETSI
jgi:hypothetical protein